MDSSGPGSEQNVAAVDSGKSPYSPGAGRRSPRSRRPRKTRFLTDGDKTRSGPLTGATSGIPEFSASLEPEFHTELQLTGSIGTGNQTKGPRREVGIWETKIRMVEEIKGVGMELRPPPFRKLEIADQ